MQCFSQATSLPHLRGVNFFTRTFCVASTLQTKSADKLVRKYLMNCNETRKKKRWFDSSMVSNPVKLAEPQMKGEKNAHRLHVLNKVFMDKICDILSTGKISSVFSGYGIEISKVRVAPGMTSVDVHWYCTGSDEDQIIEAILAENAYSLRHELSQLRVIGRVPPIQFVKDHRYHRFMEVEKRLALADYGEDFEPTDSTHHIKTSVILKTTFYDKIKDALDISEETPEEDFFAKALRLKSSLSNEVQELPLLPHDMPAMRHDVFGVDTQKIYTVIKQGIGRARADHRKSSLDAPMSYGVPLCDASTDHRNIISRTEEIKKWAHDYELQRRKEKRLKQKDDPLSLLYTYTEEDSNDLTYEDELDYMDEDFFDEESKL